MRKRMFLAIVLSLCMANFGAFSAPRGRSVPQAGGATSAPEGSVQTGQKAARAAARQPSKSNTNSNKKSSAPAIDPSKIKQTSTSSSSSGSKGGVAARAASKQKALNVGTKVASATENKTVPTECQDAFYGCMDAFCMLDNASGGRCQCSDRITELDQVLEDILKLDEQSYAMATEGVENIQMGEGKAQIMARAKAAEKEVTSKEKSDSNKQKARTLDLSAWNNSVFSDSDDIFESADDSIGSLNTFADKKGDALYKASAKMCAEQIPSQCRSYGSMLQLVYAQRIKSDCVAYENSLKAQKSQSQQKLQTAQKALRDAAMDEYKNQNRYATTGECVVAFTECMKTTAECGDDYTGCVTLAAQENVKNDKSGSKAKQTKIKGAVAGADITLAASTMEQLLAKKVICERVTKQCVNANKNDAVWTTFLRNSAPALKSAELIAEQNLRSNCIPTVAECFRNACKAKFGENDENYDMCLSDPKNYKALCKVQLEPCLEATGGSYDKPEESSLWNGLVAMLNSMKVDACTKEVKDCLVERCGEDYSGCIGLDTASIGELCPYQKLTACMNRYGKNGQDGETEVRDYVAQIAQGLALQIDNALATTCQNAANEAMLKICGDSETCPSIELDLSSLASFMKVQACKHNNEDGSDMDCRADASTFADKDLYVLEYDVHYNGNKIDFVEKKRVADADGYGVYATLVGRPETAAISYDGDNFSIADNGGNGSVSSGFDAENTQRMVTLLNGTLDRVMNSIQADPKVTYCREGRKVQGFDGSKFGSTDADKVRFPELTNGIRGIVASTLLSQLTTKSGELESKYQEDINNMNNSITERTAQIAQSKGVSVEAMIDATNQEECMKNNKEDDNRCGGRKIDGKNKCYTLNWRNNQLAKTYIKELSDMVAAYDSASNVCTVTKKTYKCEKYLSPWCLKFGSPKGENTTIQMYKLQ